MTIAIYNQQKRSIRTISNMDEIIFKQQIKHELQKMSKEQIVFFAWLCAVRALPFTGAGGNFDFWQKKIGRNI